MAGALTPIFRWQVSVDGEPVSGAKLYTYASGTSTPLSVYNNADLDPGHAHANPVVADSDGVFPVIYLSGASYRFFVTDSTGATVYPAQDNIYDLWQLFAATAQTANTVYAGPTSGASAAPTFRALVAADIPSATLNNGLSDFRLTLTTGLPVTTADVTAATTIYATPYLGNRIALYNASGAPTFYTSDQFSIAVPATTATMYDVFCYANAGVPTLELAAWATDTVRVTAVVNTVATGVYTKSGDATRRYLGSFRTTGVSGQTESSFAKRYLWNYYNRVAMPMRVLETANTWTYSTNTYQQVNASAANQLDFVVGIAEVMVNAEAYSITSSNGANTNSWTSIGLDGITAATGVVTVPSWSNNNSAMFIGPSAFLKFYPAAGRHYLTWLEKFNANGTGGSGTWYGDNGGDGTQTGIHGALFG